MKSEIASISIAVVLQLPTSHCIGRTKCTNTMRYICTSCISVIISCRASLELEIVNIQQATRGAEEK